MITEFWSFPVKTFPPDVHSAEIDARLKYGSLNRQSKRNEMKSFGRDTCRVFSLPSRLLYHRRRQPNY